MKFLDAIGITTLVNRLRNYFATLSSPAFTGKPTAPTPAYKTYDNQIATTEYVYNEKINLMWTYTNSSSSVSVPTATDTTLTSTGTLPIGYYIILAGVSFASNSTGRRVAFLSTSNTGSTVHARLAEITQPAVNGVAHQMQLTYIVHLTSQTGFYLRCYQNSGSTLSCRGDIRYYKILEGL